MINKNNQSKQLRIYLLILLAIILPMIIGYIYLHLYQSGVNLGQRNNGSLFEKTIDLGQVNLDDLKGANEVSKWLLIQVFNQNCTGECETRARLIGNIATALGKNASRIRAILLYDLSSQKRFFDQFNSLDSQNSNGENKTQIHYPIERIIKSEVFLKEIIMKLNQAIHSEKNHGIQLFLVDPQGRFVLGFKDGIGEELIIKDINILIKSSLIG